MGFDFQTEIERMPSIEEMRAKVKKPKPEEKPEVKPEPQADKPAELAAKEAVADPGKPVSPSPDGAALPQVKRKYRVSLKWNPEHVVEGFDRLDAIDAYKRHCGILSTPHEFKVEPVE